MERQNNRKLEKFKVLRTKVEKTAEKKCTMSKSSQNASETQNKYEFLNESKGDTIKNSKVPYLIKDGGRIDDNLDVAKELRFLLVLRVIICRVYGFRKQIGNEILQIFEDLTEKWSSGIDHVSTILIKKTSFLIYEHLVHLVNKSFKDGKFSSILKQA